MIVIILVFWCYFEYMYLCFSKLILFVSHPQEDIKPIIIFTNLNYKFTFLPLFFFYMPYQNTPELPPH